MKKKTIVFLLACFLVVIFAALPRSIELINGNYVFGYDQGKHWLAAKSIIVGYKFPLIGDEVGGQGGFFQGSGWYYLLAIPFFIFQGDPYGAVVLMFVLSVVMIVLFLSFFHSILGKKEALAGGFLLSFAPILISNSRFAWPPFVIPFLTIFYLWFVYRVLQKKYFNILFVFFIVGVTAHFEIATAGTLFIATLILYILWSLKERIPVKYLGLGLIGFVIPLLPLILFDLRHDFLNLKGILATLHGSRRYVGTWAEYVKIISNHWMIFSDEFFRAFQTIYIPKIYMAGFLIAGSVSMLLDKNISLIKKKFVGFLFILPVLLFLVFLLYKNDLWPWWISELTVIYAVLCAIVFVYGWQKGLVMQILVITLIGLMAASYINKTYNSFKKELSDYGGVHKINGKKDALDVIFTDAKGEQFGLTVFTPPIYTYAYDFLIPWYGMKKYGYEPPNEKQRLLYLLIEPDTGEPWRHKGWLETVIKDGTVEKTWNLPSGFIIEKRRLDL